MTDPQDHPFRPKAAERQSEVIGCHYRAGQCHRVIRRLHPKRQNDAQQTVAGHEEGSSPEEGFDRCQQLANLTDHCDARR